MDNLLVNYLRLTSCLEIEKAKSGHPGIALGSAPIVYSIYKNAFIMPNVPDFFNRDRIVVSAGHASSLIYACLHLFGFGITNSQLQDFRQLKSATTGHPEVYITPGIDATTGPLGQGVAMAVGMAIAEEYLRNKYKKDNFSPIDHYTYCFVGDGCLMEGVALEAISLAGTLKLNKLIVIYDKNDITIEGSTSITNKENVKEKFLAQNWSVIEVNKGNNVKDIENSIKKAKLNNKPTLIIVKTKIGYGSYLEGKNLIHGRPLNLEQIKDLRVKLDYFVPDWEFPENTQSYIKKILQKNSSKYCEYINNLENYKKKYRKDYSTLIKEYNNFDFKVLVKNYKSEKFDGRQAISYIFDKLYDLIPNLIGGTADLGSSTKTVFKQDGFFSDVNRTNRNIAFGIREHAMAGICNGISLHGQLNVFCSTFLAFANYLTPALRLSAIMKQPILYVFTHDSISVGEDGPTHQPIEQIATLRAMPNFIVYRPCGINEFLASLSNFYSLKLPSAFIISRQVIGKLNDNYDKAKKGGYKILENSNSILTLVACGTEVELCIKVADILMQNGYVADVVSMPSVELFEKQDKRYKNKVIDKTKKIFCIEASSDSIWYRYASKNEYVFNLSSFGLSGKQDDVLNYFGFTPNKIALKIIKFLKND